MTSFITDLIWGPQYTGLSAYLPEPFAALTSITLCYDIGSIILIGILLTVSTDVVQVEYIKIKPKRYFQLIIWTKNGKLGATMKRLVPNVSMGRVPFRNSRIFSWKSGKTLGNSQPADTKSLETAINPTNSQTERKKKRKRKRITSQTD